MITAWLRTATTSTAFSSFALAAMLRDLRQLPRHIRHRYAKMPIPSEYLVTEA
jgi:hypothetical protein